MTTQQVSIPQGKASLWAKEREQQLDLWSDASVDEQPEEFKEYVTSRWKALVWWADNHKEIVDFILYLFFLLLFTLGKKHQHQCHVTFQVR